MTEFESAYNPVYRDVCNLHKRLYAKQSLAADDFAEFAAAMGEVGKKYDNSAFCSAMLRVVFDEIERMFAYGLPPNSTSNDVKKAREAAE